MAFTQPTMPIRTGPAIATRVSVPEVVYRNLDLTIHEPASGFIPYFAEHPLLKASGLVMTWGDGNAPVIENGAGGGTPRPSVGVMWPRD